MHEVPRSHARARPAEVLAAITCRAVTGILAAGAMAARPPTMIESRVSSWDTFPFIRLVLSLRKQTKLDDQRRR